MQPINVVIDGKEYIAENRPTNFQRVGSYGNKMPSGRWVFFAGRWRHIWCRCYSNAGTLYIIVKGKEVIVH
jgi:hypothetical protein